MTFITEVPHNDIEPFTHRNESEEEDGLTINLIKHTSGHYDLTHVSQLDLSHKDLSSMNGLGTTYHLPYLIYLDLSHNSITFLTDLSLFENLKFLNLSYNSICQHPIILFNQRNKLQVLQLEGNKIHNLSSISWLEPCTNLRRLSFQRAQGQDACPICLEPDYIPTMLTVSPKLVLLDEESVVLLQQSLTYNITPTEEVFDPTSFVFTPFTIDTELEPIHYSFEEEDVMKEEKQSLEAALTDAQNTIEYLHKVYCGNCDDGKVPIDKWFGDADYKDI
jgi:hypothetical protein